MILNYHLFGFSLNYIIDDSFKTQYLIGWMYMGTIGLLIVMNMSFILYKAMKKALRARELKKMKKLHEINKKHMEEMARIELD